MCLCQKHASQCEVSGQENEEREKACCSSRYTAIHPAEWAAMGIQIPTGEEKSAKQIQKSKNDAANCFDKKKEKKRESLQAAPMLQIQN